jgi:hypothetical protein
MIYGSNPQRMNERTDMWGVTHYTLVPDPWAIRQSSNLYVYAVNNPIMFQDPSGEFIITTTALLMIGGALIFGTAGGFVGNHYANKAGATGWNRVGYIAGGATIGSAGGAALGWMAAPTVIAATGVGSISITATAGITLIPAQLLGQAHHVISNPMIRALNNHKTLSGLFDRAGSIVDALYKHSHQGYQQWHRTIDNNMVNWLSRNPNATSNQFWNELYKQYNTKDMIQRFGEGVLEFIKAQIQ